MASPRYRPKPAVVKLRVLNRFRFVADLHRRYGVKRLCSILGISRSSFYYWRRTAADRAARQAADARLAALIRGVRQDSDGTYGAPRITAELRETSGKALNHKRVARIMRAFGDCRHVFTVPARHQRSHRPRPQGLLRRRRQMPCVPHQIAHAPPTAQPQNLFGSILPTPPTTTTGSIDPHRVRDHHEPRHDPRGMKPHCHQTVSQTRFT
ncbi:IS3 family transposase [Streptomyces cyaneofuscatus]|uniref:IS3 family transposase n=1 Tax=Streptomyces cyaneofuscatus TaxID=66883 RepID=UPI00364C718C